MDLMLSVEDEIKKKTEFINDYLSTMMNLTEVPPGAPIDQLKKAVSYSVANGGKRFRPLLSVLTGEMLGAGIDKTIAFAAAVEMIHSYSLVHDDLPCMDNDDFRRGIPTNHKVFGEATALLAGDALLTQSFGLVADAYSDNSFLAMNLIRLLVEASGWKGMISGQMLDIFASKNIEISELQMMHELKTGAMIRVSVEGAAFIAGAKPSEVEHLRKFGSALGLAFQIADDILDHTDKQQEGRSYVALLGMDKTKEWLKVVSESAYHHLRSVGESSSLEYLIEFNLKRQI